MKTFRLVLALVVVLSAASAFARVWTDRCGKTTQGNFVRYFEGDVVLLRGTRVVKIPYADLSEDDRDFVRQELEKRDEAGLLPPDPDDEEFELEEPGEERTWKSNDGKKIQAKLVAVSGRKVTLLVKEKKFTVPMKRLSKVDQLYAKSLLRQAQAPTQPVQPGPSQFAGGPPSHPSMRPTPPHMPSNPPPGFHGPSHPTPAFPAPSDPSSNPPPTMPSTIPSSPQFPPHARPDPIPTPQPHHSSPFPSPFPSPGPSQMPWQAQQPPQQAMQYKYCTQCKKTIPNNLGAGDKCPHCGAFFAYEQDASGRFVKTVPLGKYIAFGGGIPCLAILVGFLIRWLRD